MRAVWRVADVRAAEAGLMGTLPEGTLMQRAAAGLARRAALVLAERGGVYGGRVLLLVGSGDNGGDALYAGERLARRGVQVSAMLVTPGRAHAAGLAALRAAGGRVVPGPAGPVDLVLDGIVGIGGTGGLRANADEIVQRLDELRGRDGERATV
ncbi:bifunctional ADP-dependent NAD(P)H-hydrate dehydratase/NAD(P)H-hydrate epimerase, partial [Micromonospora sp. M51]